MIRAVVRCLALLLLVLEPNAGLASVGQNGSNARSGGATVLASLARRDRYLVLDRRTVAHVENMKLRSGVAAKHCNNPLFKEEYEWEPRFDNLYPNVIWDDEDQLFKCWYSPFIISNVDALLSTPAKIEWRSLEMAVCYATSKDGLRWEKPMLDICPWKGKPSNIIYRAAHGAGVIKDLVERDPSRRYKMFFRHDTPSDKIVSVAFSADGLHWSPPQPTLVSGLKADTHSNALWAPSLNKYVAFTRDWAPVTLPHKVPLTARRVSRVRTVARTESDDFEKWTAAPTVLQGLENHLQTYSMQVFWHHGVYLGLVVILDTVTDRTHTELAWSTDTINWERISAGQAVVPNSPRLGDFDWGCVYSSRPVFLENEIRIYYGGSDGFHGGLRKGYLGLATLRVDGFAGYTPLPSLDAGTLTTAPFPVKRGERLYLSADVEEGGSLEIAFLDPKSGQSVARPIKINGPRVLSDQVAPAQVESPFSTETVQLKFVVKRGTIYSFSNR